MNKQYKKSDSSKGFTIIEVVLVLAIAGLIFLMVFIALPALQRGQRDAQRKSDLTRVTVQLSSYTNSSRGAIPANDTQLGTFISGFLDGGVVNGQDASNVAGDEYVDPAEGNYKVLFEPAAISAGEIGYYPRYTCDVSASNGVKQTSSQRQYALTVKLENQTAVFCIDSKS